MCPGSCLLCSDVNFGSVNLEEILKNGNELEVMIEHVQPQRRKSPSSCSTECVGTCLLLAPAPQSVFTEAHVPEQPVPQQEKREGEGTAGWYAYTGSPQTVFTEAARSSDDRYRVQPPLAYFSLLFHSTSMYARPQAAKRQRPASPRTNSARQPSCAASSSSGQEERKESTKRDSLCTP